MIEVRNLVRTYRAGETGIQALRGVNASFAQGEFTALAGPSGSGKTTLLNLLGCVDRPDSGEVLWDGKDLASLDRQAAAAFRRVNLGFIFQNFNLVPVLTALENVSLALTLLGVKEKEARERSRAMLVEAGLEGLEDRFPGRMSGGQQQRVAIARALVKAPRLILADEPTANLDSETGKRILELMATMNQRHGCTFIFSTHDPMVMGMARRLIPLHDGQLLPERPAQP